MSPNIIVRRFLVFLKVGFILVDSTNENSRFPKKKGGNAGGHVTTMPDASRGYVAMRRMK